MRFWQEDKIVDAAVSAAWVRATLFCLPFVLVAALLFVKISAPWTYWHVAGVEDGPIEWLTALIYFVSASLAVALALRFHRSGVSLHAALSGVLALGMFVIGMEEISWGQRILGIASPEFFMVANRQQELNLHNLGHSSVLLDAAYLSVTLYAMTARLWVPALLQRIDGGRYSSVAQLISPPAFLTPYFLVLFLLYSYYVTVPLLVATFGPQWGFGYIPEQGYFMISRDQEPAECILALGFLFFVVWLLALQRRGEWSGRSQPAFKLPRIKRHRYFSG